LKKKHFPGKKEAWVPTPTWGNHTPIFNDSGFQVKAYRYYEPKTKALDFKATLEDISVSRNDFD
jgi:aspartate aminotransferase